MFGLTRDQAASLDPTRPDRIIAQITPKKKPKN